MKLVVFLLFTAFFVTVTGSSSADKCSICKGAVKSIKDGKELGYLAELSAQQIEDLVRKNVETENLQKHCSNDAAVCSKLVKDLVEIADQLDDDLDSTPQELCKFQYYC